MLYSPRRFATIAVAASSLVLVAAPVAHAGVVNCVEQTRRAACYELVWVDGVAFRMTFAQAGNQVPAIPNTTVQNFYVIAPQTGDPQGILPFAHDHVIAASPREGHGNFSVFMHGYFVFCSAEGLTSGACVPTLSEIPGIGTVPLAKTVNGQMLTSVDLIEAYVDAGLLTLIDTGAEFVGTINPSG